ncbi:hypothetical protein CDL12_09304 [Handroanthus impetiginosus]|uniref:Uncharacterized protein n=1 Tax=Handroanthus impetiginosus TaxID=429701 RepID=A0A2G9HKI8_9LAMI|nr:hypothetical protein CDL12_09304 [Handroanthus impetiginosus]
MQFLSNSSSPFTPSKSQSPSSSFTIKTLDTCKSIIFPIFPRGKSLDPKIHKNQTLLLILSLMKSEQQPSHSG